MGNNFNGRVVIKAAAGDGWRGQHAPAPAAAR
jgi:hypothetical protein